MTTLQGTSGRGGLQAARRLLSGSSRLVAFTGAGVSTASGVPDFRSPGGLWSRYQPVPIEEFLKSDEARRRYWAYKKESYACYADAAPNAAHRALVRLEEEGRLLGVITQNIDGLHQQAGSRLVLELHGTNRRVVCLSCAASSAAAAVQARLNAGCEVPTCPSCGGFLKAATVSFGQPVPAEVLRAALDLAVEADLLLALGSSLVVYPAAAIPQAAVRAGAAMLIVNREPTPLDGLAAAVLHGEVEQVLPALLET